jgi:hypothetical protein
MTPQMSPPAPASLTTFTLDELRVLRTLRTRYRQDADLFSRKEVARLCFLRWLYCTGAVATTAGREYHATIPKEVEA